MRAPEERKLALAGGLTMEARRFAGGAKTPAICIPGLTRNARDFDDFAPWLAATGRDVYVVSLRGRGGSSRDPNYLNYQPTIYRDDIISALAQLKIPRAIFVGTSLGGIVTMLTNEKAPDLVAAAIINDVGPELGAEGIARIASYAGKSRGDAGTIDEAAGQIRLINEVAFPGRDAEFWRVFATRTYTLANGGKWMLDYDQAAIGRALVEAGPAPDLWPPFKSLKHKPTLIVRGAISDLLTSEIIGKMRAVHPNFALCEVADTGHAPTLTEPEVKRAVSNFVGNLDEPPKGLLARIFGLKPKVTA